MKTIQLVLLLTVGLIIASGCARKPPPKIVSPVEEKDAPYFRFLKGNLELMAGRKKEAFKEIDALIGAEPNIALFFYIKAELLTYEREFDQAKAACQKAVALDPQYTDAYILMGNIAAEKDEPLEAVKHFEKALELAPDRDRVYSLLARQYVALKRYADALAVMQRLLRVNPDAVMAYLFQGAVYEKHLKDEAAAQRMYEAALQIDQDNITALDALAQMALKRKDLPTALDHFLSIERRSPHDVSVALSIALIYYELKDYENAIARFQRILNDHPEAEKVRYYLGLLYESIDKPDHALKIFLAILPEGNAYRDARLHAASLLRTLGNADEAIDVLREAIRHHPTTAEFYEFIAALYEERKEYDKAIAILEDGQPHFPQDDRFLLMLGMLYEKQKDRERALATMQRALEVNPHNATALNYIGYTYAEQGVKLDEAKTLIERALELRPDDGYITDSLGWVYFKQGRLDRALEILQQALKLVPQEPTILYHLGEVWLKFGKRKQAERYFQQALEAWKQKREQDEDEMSLIRARLQELMGTP